MLKKRAKYENDPRFVFKRYTGRGHAVLKGDNGRLDTALVDEIINFFDDSLK